MKKRHLEELNVWAYEPLTGNGHIQGLVLRLMDERKRLLEALAAWRSAKTSAAEDAAFKLAAAAVAFVEEEG